MVCANEPIQTTDNTSGLTRRRLTVEFNRPLYNKNSEAKEMIKVDNGVVKGLWKHCIPGLVNWVLQMTDQEMRQYLLDTYEMVPSLKRVRNEIMLNSNNLVEWLQSEVVLDDKAVTPVGKKFQPQRMRKNVIATVTSTFMQVMRPIVKIRDRNLSVRSASSRSFLIAPRTNLAATPSLVSLSSVSLI